MFYFKNMPFFMKPRCLSTRDMEFDVFDKNGNFIGTNIMGIVVSNFFKCEEEKDEFEDFLIDVAMKTEILLKLTSEFNFGFKDCNLNPEAIKAKMQNKLYIGSHLLQEVFAEK